MPNNAGSYWLLAWPLNSAIIWVAGLALKMQEFYHPTSAIGAGVVPTLIGMMFFGRREPRTLGTRVIVSAVIAMIILSLGVYAESAQPL